MIEEYFTIENRITDGDKVIFSVALNPNHKVYKGHFPDIPVSPGVCNIQMIRECIQQLTGKKLLIDSIAQCKFSSIITPVENPKLLIWVQMSETEEKRYKAQVNITNPDNSVKFIDFKAEFSIVESNIDEIV